ncbi:MAG: hypothetical protein ACLSXY_01115 [Veillonella sp.]
MNTKIRDSLFACMVVTVLFTNIPKFMQINFLFGSFSRRLTVVFVCIGLLYTVYLAIKKKMEFHHFQTFKRFSIVYLLYILVSLVYGLYQYPYYDAVINGPVQQIEKLPAVIDWLQAHNIQLSQSFVVGSWMIVRFIKNAVLEYVFTFGAAYMVFNWYFKEWRKAVSLVLKSVLVSVLLILGYNCIELAYLGHIPWGEKVLSAINPYIHEIKNGGTWYPPLLEEPNALSLCRAFLLRDLCYLCTTVLMVCFHQKIEEPIHNGPHYLFIYIRHLFNKGKNSYGIIPR